MSAQRPRSPGQSLPRPQAGKDLPQAGAQAGLLPGELLHEPGQGRPPALDLGPHPGQEGCKTPKGIQLPALPGEGPKPDTPGRRQHQRRPQGLHGASSSQR